jgi:hypothetical protein
MSLTNKAKFENILETIIRESEESLEKAYQAALLGFDQTINALKEAPDYNIKKTELCSCSLTV